MSYGKPPLRQGNHQWYRNETWSDEIEAAFMTKLARCRSSRDQYLAIQAMILANSGHREAALRLCQLYIDTHTEDFNLGQVHMTRMQIFGVNDDRAAMWKAAEQALDWQKANPYHIIHITLDYPVMVALAHRREAFDRALEALADSEDYLTFALDRFKYHMAHALIAADRSDPARARQHAQEALRAVEQSEPDFPRHPKVGRVDGVDEAILTRLDQIARTGTDPASAKDSSHGVA